MVIIEGMLGMGDTVYQRPALAALTERGFIRTAWPQLISDLPNVRCVRAATQLRTQHSNILNYEGWHKAPRNATSKVIHYSTADFRRGTHPSDALAEQLGVTPNYAGFALNKHRPGNNYAIVHAGTVRTEWFNGARPCKTEYLSRLVDNHREYNWISIAWLCKGAENWSDCAPHADERYEQGQLKFEELVHLLAGAAIIVSCVGFCLPLGPALGTPTLILYGGDVPPSVLEAPWMGPLDHVAPDPFCACFAARHNGGSCNKELDFDLIEEKFQCLTGAMTTAFSPSKHLMPCMTSATSKSTSSTAPHN